jgi:serine/threonine protein phosphatase PrpC
MLTETGALLSGPLSGQEDEILREQIVTGNCVLFIGPDIGFDTSRVLPSRAMLARQLLSYQGWDFPSGLSFPWAAQYYELEHGRSSLLSFVEEKIGRAKEPPACYRTIAALPFRLILTTNYDTLLEEALDEQGVVYQKILGTYDLRHGMLDRLRVVKLYGCVTERDSVVVTEEDRFAFFDRLPSVLDILGRGFAGKTLLFIGCDLAHRDFRQIYYYLAPQFSKAAQSAFFVQRGVADSLAHYWATRGLTVVDAEAAGLLKRAAGVREVGEVSAISEAVSEVREIGKAKEVGAVSAVRAVSEVGKVEETVPSPVFEPLALEVGQLTEMGRHRSMNQDCVEVCMPSDSRKNRHGNLFIVADGMGGHNAGDTASRLAADAIIEGYYADIAEDVSTRLTHGIEAANRVIYQQAKGNSTQAGMGTTVVAAVVRERELHVANVGDSRAYLIRGGEIGQITEDHSWVAEQVRAGRMAPEEAENHPQSNLLTRVLGLNSQVEVDVFQRKLEPGDSIVLCSDGLTGCVKDDEIKEVVNECSPTSAVEQLVEWAVDGGSTDDISVVAIKVS